MKRSMKIITVLAAILLLAGLQTLPVFFVKPLGAKVMQAANFTVYYQKEAEEGAREVFNLLLEEGAAIREKMNFKQDKNTPVCIYHSQKGLAIREAGFVTLLFAPSWYIGDSHNGNIMMVSPHTKVKGHTHDSILTATLHEYVHSIVHEINPGLSYFWDNGLATYLAGQIPDPSEYTSRPFPSIEDMHTENGLKFGNMGGYAFSYKYIEFLEQAYGWDTVMQYACGKGDYETVFGKSEEMIYHDWKASMGAQ